MEQLLQLWTASGPTPLKATFVKQLSHHGYAISHDLRKDINNWFDNGVTPERLSMLRIETFLNEEDKVVEVEVGYPYTSSELRNFDLQTNWEQALNYAIKYYQVNSIPNYGWVWIYQNGEKIHGNQPALVKFIINNGYSYGFGFGGKWYDKFHLKNVICNYNIRLKPAQASEVYNALLSEWLKRAGSIDVVPAFDADSPNFNRERSKNFFFDLHGAHHYDSDFDKFYNQHGVLYCQGNWAEPSFQEFDIWVGDHLISFYEDYIQFDCIKIDKNEILELSRICERNEDDIASNSNTSITAVEFNKGFKLPVGKIHDIAEYL